jgi:hypothetical protein
LPARRKREDFFNTTLKECIDVGFSIFNEHLTIHHLLAHTFGLPDYFDEEVMADFEELWIEKPMYHSVTFKISCRCFRMKR